MPWQSHAHSSTHFILKQSDHRAKIVIITSSHKKEAMQTAKELGIKEYITKPFDDIKIEKLIENISEL